PVVPASGTPFIQWSGVFRNSHGRTHKDICHPATDVRNAEKCPGIPVRTSGTACRTPSNTIYISICRTINGKPEAISRAGRWHFQNFLPDSKNTGPGRGL